MSGEMAGREPDENMKLAAQVEMEKVSTIQRAKLSMDALLYNLHKAREKFEWMQTQAEGYAETSVYKTAASLPIQYENAIRHRNASICFSARTDGLRKSGLL